MEREIGQMMLAVSCGISLGIGGPVIGYFYLLNEEAKRRRARLYRTPLPPRQVYEVANTQTLLPDSHAISGIITNAIGQISNDVWGGDWTRHEKIREALDAIVPGTQLYDPQPKNNYSLTYVPDEDIRRILSASPLEADASQFKEYAKKVGFPDKAKENLIAFAVAEPFEAHNEGTKFGSRRGMIVSPIVINIDKFRANERFLPYALYEQRLFLAGLIRLMFRSENGSVETELLERVRQSAKTKSMEYALLKGDLKDYLAFHDSLYPQENDITGDFRRKEAALHGIEREHTSNAFLLTGAFLALARRPEQDIFTHWRQQMMRKEYSFDYLNEPAQK